MDLQDDAVENLSALHGSSLDPFGDYPPELIESLRKKVLPSWSDIPTGEAGCETEIDRSVQGKDLRSALAEWLRETEAMLADEAQFKTDFHKGERYRLLDIQRRLKLILDAKSAST